MQSLATLIDSAGVRLGIGPTGESGKDLAQAKQAIEGADALLGVLESEVGEEQAAPFREAVRVIKMAFVDVSGAAGAPVDDGAADAGVSDAAEPASAPTEEPPGSGGVRRMPPAVSGFRLGRVARADGRIRLR